MKIAIIGAGSVVFVKNLLTDILSEPELADATIALHDIDPERLETSGIMARWTADQLGAKPKIEEHKDRRESLRNADFVINMVLIGGTQPIAADFKSRQNLDCAKQLPIRWGSEAFSAGYEPSRS